MSTTPSTVHLSDIQSSVLVKIFASPNGQVAFEELSSAPEELDSNVVASRKLLQRLNLITVDMDSGVVELTQQGIQVMQDQYLLDDAQQLTDRGNQYLQYFDMHDVPDSNEVESWPTESFNLLKQINDLCNLQ